MDVINGNNNWVQNALLYEYVNGRCLILLFFKYLYDNVEYRNAMNNMLSLTDAWDIEDTNANLIAKKMIDDIHSKSTIKKYIPILTSIHKIFLSNIESQKQKNDDEKMLNGNMIQQYFLNDPIEVEGKNIINLLYGGKTNNTQWFKQYIKYLQKTNQ
jgi:hypothetical protein